MDANSVKLINRRGSVLITSVPANAGRLVSGFAKWNHEERSWEVTDLPTAEKFVSDFYALAQSKGAVIKDPSVWRR